MTKILLVEDDKSLREIYNVRLRAEGYDIVTAGDGEEALALAIKERPDLIVSDVMMPKISGFDMLDILRSTTETKNIRVIMMTALSSEEQRQRGMALGADRYLVKSQVGIEDVVRTVQEVISGKPDSGPAPLVSSEPVSEHSRADESRPQLSRVPVPTAQAIPQRPQPAAPAATPSPASTPVATPQPAPAAQPTAEPPSASQPAPVTPTAPAQPAPAAAPNPAPQPVQPVAAPAPAAAPTPAPQAPTPTSPPAPATAPAPYLKEPQSAAPTTLEPQASTLPQPVAPFSTPRPGSSGRVIQPLNTLDDAQATDFTARMSQELADTQPLSATPPPFSAAETPATPPLQNNSNLTAPQPSAQIQTAVTTTTAPTPPTPTPQPTTEPPSAPQSAPTMPVTPAAPAQPAPAASPNPAPQPVQPVAAPASAAAPTPASQAPTPTNPPTPEALAEQDLADSLAELQFEETARAENAPSQTQAPTLQ